VCQVSALNARPGLNERGSVMSKRSYYWRQAQVCMSLARVTDDPFLKERYEDLAVDFAQNAERERLESSDLESGLANTNRT
jgi:hypothetical protein